MTETSLEPLPVQIMISSVENGQLAKTGAPVVVAAADVEAVSVTMGGLELTVAPDVMTLAFHALALMPINVPHVAQTGPLTQMQALVLVRDIT